MKKLLMILPMLATLTLLAQKPQGIHQGMWRVQGSGALGLSKMETRYYAVGELEYLLSNHVGLNGTVYASLGSNRSSFDVFFSPPAADDYYVHSVLSGPIYHFLTEQPLDVYVGIQPGVSITQLNYLYGNAEVGTEYGLSPTASALTGIAYYGSFFHLFGQVRYVGTRHATVRDNTPLRDVRLSFGLGFNLR